MSYRTFKHLLGETSLERKCRFIFGGGILLLVTWLYFGALVLLIGAATNVVLSTRSPPKSIDKQEPISEEMRQ